MRKERPTNLLRDETVSGDRYAMRDSRGKAPFRRAGDNADTVLEIFHSSPEIIISVDLERKITAFNKRAESVFGYSAEEVLGRSVDILYADPAEGRGVNQTVRLNGDFNGEITNRRKDGSTFTTFISASPLFDAAGRVIGTMGRSQDITDFRMAGEALKQSERFLGTIFDSIKDPFSILDRDFTIVKANEAYSQLRNKSVEEILGEKCHRVFQDRDEVCDDCVVKKTFDSSDPCAKDKRLELFGGGEIWVEIYTYPILNEEGQVSHVIEYTRDITARKRSEDERKRLIEKLEFISSTDVLTGLLNRRALMDRLEFETERARRYQADIAVVLCDIDYFKEINDRYGHTGGDLVLQGVSGLLKAATRKSDIVGRYGGDEFMMILPATSLPGAMELSERTRAAFEGVEVLNAGGESVSISMSMGIAHFHPASEQLNITNLVKRADAALYTAKRTGRNRVCFEDSK